MLRHLKNYNTISLSIDTQLIRHRSFAFPVFSQLKETGRTEVNAEKFYIDRLENYYFQKNNAITRTDKNFREIASNEIYDLPDVLDRLDEATCNKINFVQGYESERTTVKSVDLAPIPKNDLAEYYRNLSSVEQDAERQELVPITIFPLIR